MSRLHFLLGQLEEARADVLVHDVHLFVHFSTNVSQTVRVRFESARFTSTSTTESWEHPQTSQAVDSPAGELQLGLSDQRRAFGAFGFSRDDVSSQRLDFIHHKVGVSRIARSIRKLF